MCVVGIDVTASGFTAAGKSLSPWQIRDRFLAFIFRMVETTYQNLQQPEAHRVVAV